MISYIYSFIWDQETQPTERQVHLRHLLHKQIKDSNLKLRTTLPKLPEDDWNNSWNNTIKRKNKYHNKRVRFAPLK